MDKILSILFPKLILLCTFVLYLFLNIFGSFEQLYYLLLTPSESVNIFAMNGIHHFFERCIILQISIFFFDFYTKLCKLNLISFFISQVFNLLIDKSNGLQLRLYLGYFNLQIKYLFLMSFEYFLIIIAGIKEFII